MRNIFHQWKPIGDIPNRAHFKLVVLRKDGKTVTTKVRRNNKTGFHTLIGQRVGDLTGWMEAVS